MIWTWNSKNLTFSTQKKQSLTLIWLQAYSDSLQKFNFSPKKWDFDLNLTSGLFLTLCKNWTFPPKKIKILTLIWLHAYFCLCKNLTFPPKKNKILTLIWPYFRLISGLFQAYVWQCAKIELFPYFKLISSLFLTMCKNWTFPPQKNEILTLIWLQAYFLTLCKNLTFPPKKSNFDFNLTSSLFLSLQKFNFSTQKNKILTLIWPYFRLISGLFQAYVCMLLKMCKNLNFSPISSLFQAYFWQCAKIELFPQKNEDFDLNLTSGLFLTLCKNLTFPPKKIKILTLIWLQAYSWLFAKIKLFPPENKILTLIWPYFRLISGLFQAYVWPCARIKLFHPKKWDFAPWFDLNLTLFQAFQAYFRLDFIFWVEKVSIFAHCQK